MIPSLRKEKGALRGAHAWIVKGGGRVSIEPLEGKNSWQAMGEGLKSIKHRYRDLNIFRIRERPPLRAELIRTLIPIETEGRNKRGGFSHVLVKSRRCDFLAEM